MKKSVQIISRFFLIIGLSWIYIIGNSQDFKLTKKEQKEAKKAERIIDYEALGPFLEGRIFAFETNRIQGTTGATVYNVVQVDEAKIFVRCEDPKNTSGGNSGVRDNSTPPIGPTGLFFEGDIDGWKLSKNSKNLSYTVRFEVRTTGGNPGIPYEINMNINSNKSADIEIKSRGGHMVYSNYTGHIRTL